VLQSWDLASFENCRKLAIAIKHNKVPNFWSTLRLGLSCISRIGVGQGIRPRSICRNHNVLDNCGSLLICVARRLPFLREAFVVLVCQRCDLHFYMFDTSTHGQVLRILEFASNFNFQVRVLLGPKLRAVVVGHLLGKARFACG